MKMLSFRRRIEPNGPDKVMDADPDVLTRAKHRDDRAFAAIRRLNEAMHIQRRASSNLRLIEPKSTIIPIRSEKLLAWERVCNSKVIKPKTGELEKTLYPR